MVGSGVRLAGGILAVAMVLGSRRAEACSVALPPPELVGFPTPGEQDVPTDAIPIFWMFRAGIEGEPNLALTELELVSSSGAAVSAMTRLVFNDYFEVVSETPLEPSTTYTIRVTPPPRTTATPSVTLSLSFTTGTGPLETPPPPPDARVQHFRAATTGTTCDPGTQGSCIFFSGSAVEVWLKDRPQSRNLIFSGSLLHDLVGLSQTREAGCVSLRTRGADGSTSDVVDVCAADGETLLPSSTAGLTCTARGLEKDGVPLDGSGGTGGGAGAGGSPTGGTAGAAATTSTGGTPTGGASTGGTATGGAGNVAGAPDEDSESRRIVTEGCGCRTPGTTRHPSWPWLSLGLSLVAGAAFRRRAR